VPVFDSLPLLKNSAGETAQGVVVLQMSAPFTASDGSLITRATSQARIINGVLMTEANTPLSVPETPAGVALDMWFQIDERKNGSTKLEQFHWLVEIPAGATVAIDALVHLEAADVYGDYVPSLAVQTLLDQATASANAAAVSEGNAATSATDADTARIAAEAVGATTDGLMTGVDADSASAYRVQADARLSATIGAAFDDTTQGVSGPDIVQWGDSMTQQMGSVELAAATGQIVRNAGVGGESSAGIAARQGATPYTLIPSGASIPASGGVAVQFKDNKNTWPLLQGDGVPDGGFSGLFAGVHGTITLVKAGAQYVHDAGDVYTFTRTTTGSAVPITRPEPFTLDFGIARRNDIAVIWAGRNNYLDPDQVVGDVAVMVEYLTALRTRYVIVNVLNGRGQPIGSSERAAIVLLNKRLELAYGRRYIDLRSYMIQYGLSDTGIAPTPSDVADIAADIVPTSLRSEGDVANGSHPASSGKNIVANQVARRLAELGWIDAWAPVAPPAVTDVWPLRPNLLSNPSLEVDTTSWTTAVSATIARDTTKPFDGYASLKVTVTGTSGQGAAHGGTGAGGRITVAPSKLTVARARMFAPTGQKTRVVIHLYDGAGAYLGNFQAPLFGTGDWQMHSVEFTPTAAAATARFETTVEGTVAGDFWVDGAELYQAA